MPKAKKKLGTPPSVGNAAKEADALVAYLKARAASEPDPKKKANMLKDAKKIAAASAAIVSTCKSKKTLNVWDS